MQFNGLPSTGKCEGNWNWHVEDNHFGYVPLAGLNFSAAVNWPGAIHHGGEGLVVIDERADPSQREAIRTLLSGGGGPWKIIAATIGTLHEHQFAPYEVEVADYHSRVTAGAFIRL